MSDVSKRCPNCGAGLLIGHKSGLTTYECPQAHGVGVNIVEAYGHFQGDELEAIWSNAKGAPLTDLPSPVSGRPMVEVRFIVDDDHEYDNAGDGAREMVIELDVENHFGWFSFEELRSMPPDTSRRGPAGPGLVGLDQLDRGEAKYEAFFDDLSEADYATPKGTNRLFGGLARRLRG